MKQSRLFIHLLLATVTVLLVTACYKDKGNYTYHIPEEPQVAKLDSVYRVYLGDSLIIDPGTTLKTGARLQLDWVIGTPNPNEKPISFTGPVMRVVFNLSANQYTGTLTISNLDNGMKYFHTFTVIGQTAFVQGTTVLSVENNVTQLSFIRPDGTVQARVFQSINPGVSLPANPSQLLASPVAYQPQIQSYWILGKSGKDPGIRIDANTFAKTGTLANNFFDAPDTTLAVGRFYATPLGVLTGVINGKLYNGATTTWNQSPTYGMFGQGAAGDYNLSPEMVLNYTGTYGPGNYVGFDVNRKQFVRFNLYSDATYFGTSYIVQPNAAFDPTNLGMDLLHLQAINGSRCYAYCKATEGNIYELKFSTNFNDAGNPTFTAEQKTLFPKPQYITAATQWAATASEIIYLSSADKIYRYNPINQSFIQLTTDFGGKTVTMLKLLDQNTLLAGVEGTLYYLDVSTGKYGDLEKKIDGIPGSPVDVAVRMQ